MTSGLVTYATLVVVVVEMSLVVIGQRSQRVRLVA
jgi:hypothetical protein